MTFHPIIEQAISESAHHLDLFEWYGMEGESLTDWFNDASVAALTKYCPELRSVKVPYLNRELIELLAALPHLTSLTLETSFRFDSPCRTLSHLTELTIINADLYGSFFEELPYLSNLQALSLNWCCFETENFGVPISKLSKLRKLRIWESFTGCISDDDIELWSKLTELEELNIDLEELVTDRGFKQLTQLVRLKRLILRGCGLLTDDGLLPITRLVRLEELSLEEAGDLSEPTLIAISKLKSLKILKLDKSRAKSNKSDESFRKGIFYLSKLTKLDTLELDRCGVENISSFSYLKGLKSLSLQGSFIQEEFVHLVHLRHQLKALKLSYNSLYDENLKYFEGFSALEKLNLESSKNLTGDGLIYLAMCKSLKILNLRSCKNLKPDAIKHLYPIQSLIELNLHECNQITDESLKFIGQLSNLEILDLESCNLITNGGIAFLSPCKKLRKLNLSCKLLTDDMLQHLMELKQLEELTVINRPKVSYKSLTALVQAHPSLRGWQRKG